MLTSHANMEIVGLTYSTSLGSAFVAPRLAPRHKGELPWGTRHSLRVQELLLTIITGIVIMFTTNIARSSRFVIFAGPATDKIFEVQIVRFVVFAAPATDKIFEEVQIVRLVVFAGPATDEILEL